MTFNQIYQNRPDKKEIGSSGYSNLKHLYDYCIKLKSKIIIESGTWKGNSSYLFRMACPNAKIICHDINFDRLMWRHKSIVYNEWDIDNYFELISFSARKISDVLWFFDDHINQEKRLKWLIAHGFKHAIFDDNMPPDMILAVKNPAKPTLEMLRKAGKLPELKEYIVLPNLVIEKKDTFLTYIEI